ncbi:MAG: DUF1501 domain-containing protein, partial [Verrucomicrobia bacterium]|nr:DUF1501 domain-containing protein [Verrucomicrobiota bacterium]
MKPSLVNNPIAPNQNIEERRTEISRRQFLSKTVPGVGVAALASLLNPQSARATHPGSHFGGKVKRVIWLTQAGAPSQLDLFDYKPQLKKLFGESLPDSVRRGQRL